MKVNKAITHLFNLSIFLQICIGAHAWFLWNIEKGILAQIAVVVFAIVALLYKNINNFHFKKSPQIIIVLVFFFLAYITSFRFSIPFLIGVFLRLIPIWVLLSIPEPRRVLKWVIKAFCILFVPGIVLYFLLLVSEIPGFPCHYHDSSNYYFWNYLFIIKPMFGNDASMMRFCSVFLEPGYLGTLVSFLLYTIGFDIKSKTGKILLITEILSFSLAGYIVTSIGYIIYRFSQRHSVLNVLTFIILLFGVLEFSKVYNDGNNAVNQLITERLQFDEEKGFEGNNRTGDGADFYFERVTSSSDIFFGLGVDEVARINGHSSDIDKVNKIHGAGYKIFIITYGIIPVLLFFFFYWNSASVLCSRNKIYSRGFVLIIAITFIQAAYPDSNSWVIPFLLGIRTNNISSQTHVQ